MEGAVAARRGPRGNVLALGLVSLFTDLSSEMVVPLLPVFLTGLGAGAAALGLIEGLADGVASFLKLWSGRVADRTGRRRALVVGGYTLSSLARPLVALATAPAHVLAVRVTDRIGKGLRSSARDALLSDSVPAAHRGAAFGFQRAMDHAGAVLGPLAAMALLAWVTDDLRVVFALAAVPALCAVAVVTLAVREVEVAPPPTPGAASERRLAAALLPIVAFALGHASDTFLLLRVSEAGVAAVWAPLVWAGLHVVKSASSIPGGRLADRLGPRVALGAGWGVTVLTYGALAVLEDARLVVATVLVYGLHHGLAEPAERAWVAAVAPRGRGGEAFGWYHLGLGLAAVVASVAFGGIWELAGHGWAFGVSAALAAGAVALLAVAPRA